MSEFDFDALAEEFGANLEEIEAEFESRSPSWAETIRAIEVERNEHKITGEPCEGCGQIHTHEELDAVIDESLQEIIRGQARYELAITVLEGEMDDEKGGLGDDARIRFELNGKGGRELSNFLEMHLPLFRMMAPVMETLAGEESTEEESQMDAVESLEALRTLLIAVGTGKIEGVS